MRYDISKASAPKMPNLGKGTECIKILLSQVSNDIREPLVPMLFPILEAHLPVGKISLKASFGRIFALSGHFHTRKWQS